MLDSASFSNASGASGGTRKSQYFAPGLQRASPGDICGFLASNVATVAKPIVADRLHFRGKPVFDASPFLDERGRQIYLDPVSVSDDPSESLTEPPSVKIFFGSADETWKLLHKLDATGRLGLLKESEIFPGYQAGLFSVQKDGDSYRLIFDSRPWNTLEHVPRRWIYSMSSAAVLCDMILQEDEVCVTSGTDLREFYYSVSASRPRLIRNSLLISAWPWEVKDFACYNSDLDDYKGRVFFGLRTLSMGDSCAVEVAQTAHVGILTQLGLLTEQNMLGMYSSVPRTLSMIGVVIDDLVFFEKLSRLAFAAGDFEQLQTGSALDLALARYTELGLIPHPGKTFKFEAVREIWGCLFDGAAGQVRASLKRVVPILMITVGIIRMGVCSIQLLEVLIGSWTSTFLFRRRLLALFNVCYAAVQAAEDRTAVIRLSYDIKMELFLRCALAPFACTCLRTKSCDDLYASDASSWGLATVTSELPKWLRDEIHRHKLRRNVWTKLLSPEQALLRLQDSLEEVFELLEGEPLKSHPLWISLARGLQFSLVTKRKIRDGVHINISELRGMLQVEKDAVRSSFPVRVFNLSDSQVALGALNKGRSSSLSLNQELQQSMLAIYRRRRIHLMIPPDM